MTEKEGLYYVAKAMNSILTCYNQGIKLPDILKHLEKIKEENGCYINPYVSANSKIYVDYDFFLENVSKFKEIIADFAGINTQQNNSIDEDSTVSVYSAVESLVKAYDLKELAAKVNALPASDTQQNDSFEQFQPAIHAFMDAYDIDTAAAFNTKIYQLIASDIQDSKTNSALQQQLETLCNQVETLTGQVQQLREQIQQLKNPPTKSE